MKLKILAAAAIAVTLPATGAFAMDTLDANGDGLVTYDELLAAVPTVTEESFVAIDTNGDGALDADEYAAAEADGTLPVSGG
ncbi:MAG: hypothetical protein AAGK37_04230 [Pseudomonadota bacterium]